MATLDIRNQDAQINDIVFANKEGGEGRLYKLERFVPVQFHLVTSSGFKVHVKMEDVDNLIEALKTAKKLWA
ncbi:hypothetical protein vBValCWD615_30 [Vibrio phage vB_ValC_WD615]|nr:hypothetical protein vBValCWD615_30 [Vibrio phage vB_ValC_WD615]